jgi:serine/threonine protein kinase
MAKETETVRIDVDKKSQPTVRTGVEVNPVSSEYSGQMLKDRYEIRSHTKDKTGGEADIYVGFDNQSDETVIIKIYHHGYKPKEAILKKISELKILGLVKILDYGEIGERFFEIQQFARGGNLAENLPITEKKLKEVLGTVAAALKSLHETGIVHRDIKPENILYLDEKKTKIVLGDFGIATLFDDTDLSVRMTKAARTRGYAAPEAFSSFIARESDYYSLGITILELLTGLNPFVGLSEEQVMYKTMAEKIAPPENFSGEIQKLISGLLIKERDFRYGFDEIQKYLNGIELSLPQITAEEIADIRQRPIQSFFFDKGKTQKVENLSHLILLMRGDYEQALKHLRRGQITTVLRHSSKIAAEFLDMATDIDDLSDQEKDDEVFYIKAIYKLQGKPRFLGVCETPEELGKYMAENRELFLKALWR